MFSSNRSRYKAESFSKSRVGKASSSKQKRLFRDTSSSSRRPVDLDLSSSRHHQPTHNGPSPTKLTSAIVTLTIGPAQAPRLFAAHEDVLKSSPFFRSALHSAFYNGNNPNSPESSPHSNASSKQLALPNEIPEIFSCILEYLYKGDYFPKLEYDKRRDTWQLENATISPGNADSTVFVQDLDGAIGGGAYILKDSVVYCAAEKYGLLELKRLALRKQGLQSGIPVATILASARYAYAHTPESDSKLRAHYLQLIIRSRNTFKRSGTMQVQMGSPVFGNGTAPVGSPGMGHGTGLWFDLFVAMCNHLDNMEAMVKSPR